MRTPFRFLIPVVVLSLALLLAACATEITDSGAPTPSAALQGQLQPSTTVTPESAPPAATPQRETTLPAEEPPVAGAPTSTRASRTSRPTLRPTNTSEPVVFSHLDCDPTITSTPTPRPTRTTTPRPSPPIPTVTGPPPTPTDIVIIDCAGCDWTFPGTVVKWYVGLGTGTSLEQVEKEQVIVDEYNSGNTDNIYIALNVIPNGEANNVLATQLDAGTPPDIIGPQTMRGFSFAQNYGDDDNLLPLDDLIARCHVDLSVYDEALLAPLRNEQGQLLALSQAAFPSFIYFNKDLFDQAGLPYPPQKFGADYEGKEWNMDTLRELAMRLTLDANGRHANEAGFDPMKIVQFGFVPQWNDSAISEGAFFGAGDLTGENNEATIPEAWQEAWRWFYQARHVDHFVPNAAYTESDEFGKGNVWSSGKVAMAWTHLWYTCCFTDEQVPRWDIAVVPSYNGTYTSKLHVDTFAILKQTENPEAAFRVLMFLMQNAELQRLYGGMPAIKADRSAYFTELDKKFASNKVSWQVVLDSLAYPDVPNHEQHVPNYLKFQDRYIAFDQLRHADPNLDLEAEIARLEQDLTVIFQEQ